MKDTKDSYINKLCVCKIYCSKFYCPFRVSKRKPSWKLCCYVLRSSLFITVLRVKLVRFYNNRIFQSVALFYLNLFNKFIVAILLSHTVSIFKMCAIPVTFKFHYHLLKYSIEGAVNSSLGHQEDVLNTQCNIFYA